MDIGIMLALLYVGTIIENNISFLLLNFLYFRAVFIKIDTNHKYSYIRYYKNIIFRKFYTIMCGISGIVNKNNTPINIEEIKSINDKVAHRGPDGEGFYYGDNFAFGHRRLAIIDLTDKANQPMNYLDDYIVTFNGAIYNYIELRDELKTLGFQFETTSDTEVLLASYVQWGSDCVTHFNGMWAFSIFDKKKNILFCSRDRFGIKPFYYFSDDNKFIFGSEIKQLIPYLKVRKVNTEILKDFLVTGVLEHTDKTFFRNIFKLPASHNLIYDLNSHSYRLKRYYRINTKNISNNNSFEECKEEYRNLLKNSVKIRMRSDTVVGSCLSGGIDSSVISGLVKESKVPDSYLAIHTKSIEVDNDESGYAKHVSQELDFNLKILEPQEDLFVKNLERVVELQEEPFGSPSIFMSYFIFKKAKELGLKVMLDGQGGDETLLGYEKYFPAYFREVQKNKGLYQMSKEIYLANVNNKKMRLLDIFKFIIGTRHPKIRKMAYRKRLFFMKNYDDEFAFLKEFSSSYSDLKSLQRLEIEKMMLPELLKYEDKNSMYNSVETRLPYLDYRCVQCGIDLKSEYKMNSGWTKFILRDILSDLVSKKVAWRKKKNNFNAPTETWLDYIKPQIIEEISNSKIIEKLAYKKLIIEKFDKINLIVKWRLFNIALWERIYKMEI